MIIKATQTYTRQTPRKVRLVANSIKKLTITQALEQLSVIERKASIVVLKVLRQAIANAINNHGLAFNDLTIKSIQVQNGPYYKRFRAASRGRAHSIYKKTSHVLVELETITATKEIATEQITAKADTNESKTETKAKANTKAEAKVSTKSKKTSPKAKVAKSETDKE